MYSKNSYQIANARAVPSYEHYMRVWRYEVDHVECHWNGPSWHYQTTQILTALSNVLDYHPASANAVTFKNILTS
jgi:hypothetical protein